MSGKRAKQKRQVKKAKTERDFYNEVKKKGVKVNLLKTVQILDKTITSSLCENVFQTVRTSERQRVWSLYALTQFWNAVVIHAPRSLRQALEEASEGKPDWPGVESSAEAFFQRSQNLSWRFSARLYELFAERIQKIAARSFAEELKGIGLRFPEIRIVDASSLDAIANRLKILWKQESVILPGRIMAAYDLFRGYASILSFSENAMESENKQLQEILAQIPKQALILGDRIYATAKTFGALSQGGRYGLFRRHASLHLRKIRCLSRKRVSGGKLEDWLVEAGCGYNGVEKQTLRWICFRNKGRGDLELLSSVLDPEQLSAEEAMELYEYRWDVERLFYDLKEVLNLHRFYAGNVNAVGMQVYAAVMVHTAMRIAQAQIAQENGMAPEKISIEKFFPRMAAAVCRWHGLRGGAQLMKDLNPKLAIKEPNWNRVNVGSVKLHQIMVEPREGPPKKDLRASKPKRNFKSLHKIVLSYSEN